MTEAKSNNVNDWMIRRLFSKSDMIGYEKVSTTAWVLVGGSIKPNDGLRYSLNHMETYG